MKVLHICITDDGGAGLCCRRIHHAIKDAGIDSRILTLLKFSNDPDVIRAPKGWRWVMRGGLNKVLEVLHLPLTDKLKVRRIAKHNKVTLTMPVTAFKTLHRHTLIQWADIIHLHGIAGFVDYPSFFANVDKPVVWTQHDEILFSGLSHFNRTRQVSGKLENKYYNIKLNAVHQAKQLGIVFLSEMMYGKFGNHEMIKDRPSVIINNPVDTTSFHPIDRQKARYQLGIPLNAHVFTFVAASISNPWKGLRILCEAFQKMHIDNLVLIAVGENTSGEEWPDFVMQTGPIRDAEKLSVAYSAADFFISPSLQEAFSQTPIEAMACGIPAILTPVSGTSELINETNGVRCKGFTAQELIDGIQIAINRSYNAGNIIRDIQIRFSPNVIASKYIAFYREMIKNIENI